MRGVPYIPPSWNYVLTCDGVAEIYRIVSSKALDQGESGPGPSQGTSIPLSSSTPAGDGSKKGQCC